MWRLAASAVRQGRPPPLGRGTATRRRQGAGVPVSLATVYNALHQFTEVGLLRILAVEGAKTYFDTNTSGSPPLLHRGREHASFDIADRPRCWSISLPHAPQGMEIANVDIVVQAARQARRWRGIDLVPTFTVRRSQQGDEGQRRADLSSSAVAGYRQPRPSPACRHPLPLQRRGGRWPHVAPLSRDGASATATRSVLHRSPG